MIVTRARVPVPTPWCVIREQEAELLFYNPRTDELHFIPPSGYHVYGMCDGFRTIDDICGLVAAATRENPADARQNVESFLAQLAERGIVELEDA
jgi:coenzyme PQQ synthesis protein D (PqqD)